MAAILFICYILFPKAEVDRNTLDENFNIMNLTQSKLNISVWGVFLFEVLAVYYRLTSLALG